MFSLLLKELRLKKGLSQRELAQILNVSTGTVGNWETGTREPDFAMTIKIADFLNVSLDTLLGRERRSDQFLTSEVTSPSEKELLTAFRKIGQELGPDGQQTVLAAVKLITERKP